MAEQRPVKSCARADIGFNYAAEKRGASERVIELLKTARIIARAAKSASGQTVRLKYRLVRCRQPPTLIDELNVWSRDESSTPPL